jgi:CxxC-x17-CxxC domain-containing protein
MAKLLDRLVSLEKKMDTIISQTGGAAPQAPAPAQQPRRDRVLYEAVCADCSKVCEVPFRPSEDRAVYCKECFGRRKSNQSAGRQGTHKPPTYPTLTPVAMPSKAPEKPQPPAPIAKKSKKKK